MGWLRSHWTHATSAAVLAVVVHTWPLATDPARLSLHYNADVMLNEWIISWIQHQLPRDPLDLFDGNIFYPAKHTLAFSEPLIVPALLGYPIRLLGGSPVLVHNLLLLGGLVLSVLAAYALVYRWTGNAAAGLLAGFVYTFNPQTLMRIEHLQAVHAYGLPLSLLAADTLLDGGNRRQGIWLGLLLAMMAYTSGYLVVFGIVAVTVLMIVRVRAALSRRVIGALAAGAVVSALLVVPLYLPYRQVANEQNMRRPIESVTQFSATADGYLASFSRLHHAMWNAGAPREFPDAYFPGIVVILLAAVGIITRSSRAAAGPRLWTMIGLCVVGFVLSLGTNTPVYGWLYEHVPLISSLRAAGRFGILFLLGIAGLAAFGLGSVQTRLPSRTAARVLAGLVLIVVNLEALRAPLVYTPYRGIQGPYSFLATEPGPVVLVEVPFHLPQTIFLNAEYVFNSTAHWRPLMNGYSGYTPGTYRELVKTFWDFPAPHAVEAMRAAGATHLMVHARRFGADDGQTLRDALANPRLERVAVGRDDITLFRIR